MFPEFKIEIKHRNERDVEIPILISVVEKNLAEITSLLDVGAHFTEFTYAPALSSLLADPRRYFGIDFNPDPGSERFLDAYIVGNVMNLDGLPLDFVSCVSSLEHYGVKFAISEDWVSKRYAMFRKLCDLTKKFLFVTMPYGKDGMHEKEYANLTDEQLTMFCQIATCMNMVLEEVAFYFNEFPQQGKEWVELNNKEASLIPYDDSKGTRCVALLLFRKIE